MTTPIVRAVTATPVAVPLTILKAPVDWPVP